MEKEEVDVPELSKIPIGATVSVITAIKFRYEGTVTAVNSLENTITLQNVHFWGTKDKNNETVSTQNTEVKGPTIGTHFDSITFWMSNVIKLTIELTSEAKNEIGDTAVKTSSTAETIKTPIKRPVTANVDSQPSSRNSNTEVHNERRHNRGPRPYAYNQRRRNQGAPRQQVTYNPSPAPNGCHYAVPLNELPAYRTLDGRHGRRNNRNRTAYPQDRNGGMFVYLPPEVAAVYRPQGMHGPPAQFSGPRGNGRRRNYERRPGPSRNSPVDSVKRPDYDFETANAELEAELAKLTITSETTESRDSPSSRQILSISSETCANHVGKTSDSGASGDAVTTGIGGAEAESSTAADTARALSSGEFYVREKCFFDQISRSEGGPRGPVSSPKVERSRFNHESNRGQGRSVNGPTASTARRERQLNIETFGPMASRNTYNSRRRPAGNASRNVFISATA